MTEKWGQEPFENLRPKIEVLCTQLWPKSTNIQLERLSGGGGNRVVAIP